MASVRIGIGLIKTSLKALRKDIDYRLLWYEPILLALEIEINDS
jgi:hypothetical protein